MKQKLTALFPSNLLVASFLISLSSCSKNTLQFPKAEVGESSSKNLPKLSSQEEQSLAKAERKSNEASNANSGIVSAEARKLLDKVNDSKFLEKYSFRTRASLLYFLDTPAHKEAMFEWLKSNNAEIQFHSEALGYIDALVDWKSLKFLADGFGNLGLEETSVFKLEIENFETNLSSSSPSTKSQGIEKSVSSQSENSSSNSSYFGPSHSAGYGARVEEF
jgi:hypothetical protein